MKNRHVFTRFAIALLLLLTAISVGGGSSSVIAQMADCAAPSGDASPSPADTGAGDAASPAAVPGADVAFVPKDIVNNYFANSF